MSPCLTTETLEALARNALGPEQRASMLEHLGECETCNALVAEILATSESVKTSGTPLRLEPGDQLGRYVLISRLGVGAMGAVYRANDPLLGRHVAIKVLHELTAVTQSERLVIEARALAKLEHPNVVPVFEVGNERGNPFLVMQLVEGETLAQWLVEPRPWREVVLRFLDAARGLSAAHEAGLVHGDFKPANVLVDRTSRSRVTDFGLGLIDTETPHEAGVGTPAYMAPEVAAGARPDARSDQFSFFVALFEALNGARPTAAVSPGRVAPRWLHRIMARGLSESRWPSMKAVITELEKGLSPRHGRLVAAGLAMVAVTWLLFRPIECTDDQMNTVWNPAIADQAKAASGASFEAIRAGIERYVTTWQSTNRMTCEPIQRNCLLNRREALRVFIDSVAHASAQQVPSFVYGVNELPDISTCADIARLESPVAPPKNPSAVASSQGLAAQSAMLRDSRQLAPARVLAESAWAIASDAGYTPAMSLAQYQLCVTSWAEFDNHAAFDQCKAAAWQAERDGDSELVVLAASAIVRVQGALAQFDDAKTWSKLAEQHLERLHAPALLRAEVESAEGALSHRMGRHAEAITHARAALELLQPRLGEAAPAVLDVRMELSEALRGDGQYDASLAEAEAVLAIAQQKWGEGHAFTADALRVLASVERRMRRLDDAALHFEQAASLSKKTYGPDTTQAFFALSNLATVYRAQDKLVEASAVYEEAMRIARLRFAENDPALLLARSNRAATWVDLGRLDDAEPEMREILAKQQVMGFGDRAATLGHLVQVQIKRGRLPEALVFANEALALQEANRPADHPSIGDALGSVVEVQQAMGHWHESIEPLRRMLKIETDPAEAAKLKLQLAGALAHER